MYIKGIEAVFRAILYSESCIGIAFSCEEYSKEYFDEIKRIINKYEIVAYCEANRPGLRSKTAVFRF